MDGRRRLAEPVTEGAAMRPAAGGAPASRRSRARSGLSLGSARLGRFLRRWLGPVQSWNVPRGTGIAAFSVFVLATVGFGMVRGDHVPAIIDELRDWRDAGRRAHSGAFGHRFSEASSTIHRTSSSNVMPAWIASSGTSEVSVMPG